jgi:hypothetical protein
MLLTCATLQIQNTLMTILLFSDFAFGRSCKKNRKPVSMGKKIPLTQFLATLLEAENFTAGTVCSKVQKCGKNLTKSANFVTNRTL